MKPALGVDLIGTLDYAPEFFRLLIASWDGPTYVLTLIDDKEAAQKRVKDLGISVTEVICVRKVSHKKQWAKKLNITVFFDDSDEVVTSMLPQTTVFKIRNRDNFDSNNKKWK